MKISFNTHSYLPLQTRVMPLRNIFATKSIAVDVVSFSSANVDKDDAFNLRNIPDLPCACCGKTMINEAEYSRYTSKHFQGPAISVLKKLKHFAKDFRPTEKTVYNLLKRSALRNPNDDLNALLNKRYYYHLGRLEAKQLKIINKAVAVGENLSDDSKKELNNVLVNVRDIMFVESKNERQKRSRIIKAFEKFVKIVPEKELANKMLKILSHLPSSSDNVDSFVTKYSHRGNREIGQRLMSPSLPTLDHIKASSKGGKDEFSNMIVMCEKCNSARGNMSYKDWLQIHPEMNRYIQKNIDHIIKEINAGRLENFDTYPKEVAKTLYKESGYKLKINTRALKTKH